ncbi:MAG: sel1 repeat family protein [Streptomyces sp.]|nr:sel1 repeat family protein [Streptomyces sp.]NUT31018.1 sel1 repeat family protein [Streptomyces sp.]
MATELEQLRDALVRVMGSSPDASRRIAEALDQSGVPGAVELWFRTPGGAVPDTALAREWVRLLATLRRNHPKEFSDLQTIAAERTDEPAPPGPASGVTAAGPRSIAAGGDIGVAVTGDNAHVVTGGVTHNVAGDHLDFRESTFHDRVVGVQHNHYGAVPAPADWRPVRQVGPLEFGVRPTRPVPGVPDVPPYVERDCDEDLRAKLTGHGLVVILGEPCAGKSYTAWRAVRSLKGQLRLYAPDAGEDLRPLVAAFQGDPGRYVVWLDELTGHLGAGGLDLRLLGRLNDLGAVVLATMSPDEYYRRRAGTAPGDRVVAAARTVELAREWSDAELARLAALDDPRAYPAYVWSGREGVASYFAVGHHLYDEWRRVGTQLEHPRGQLLVRAAVDLARCGVTAAVPTELLRKVQEQYRAEDRESFEDALAWATAPMFGASGLLVAGAQEGTRRAYGALVAEALRSGDLEPVPDEVWWTLLDAAREPGAPLDFPAVLDAARTALSPRVEAGDPSVALGFARRTEGDEREVWLRRAAKAGDAWAAVELAEILRERGEESRALSYLERAAESGSEKAAARLGSLLRDRAEHWLRRAAEAGDAAAAHELGDMLVGGLREGEALHWYREAAAAGRREVATSLGVLLVRWRDPEGEQWLRYASEWGDARAASELGAYLSWQDDSDPADLEGLYQQAIDGGDADAARDLGLRREGDGRLDDAMALYRLAHERDALDTEALIAALLAKQGKTVESEEWARKAVAVNLTGLLETLPPPPPRAPTTPPDTVKE